MVENADIAATGCDIASSFYIEWPGAREAVDSKMLNAEIGRIVAGPAELRAVDASAADLEGNAV